MLHINNSTDVRRSQAITRREDARELLPEEKLSPLDLEIYDRVIEKAKLLPGNELDRQMVIDAINEAAGLGSKEFLHWAKWLGIERTSENQILTLRDIIGQRLPDIDYYITDILRAKGYIALIGKRKAGKSLLVTLLALCLAVGREWLTMRVKPEGVIVLYLNYEISHEKFMERLQDMSGAMEITPDDKFMLKTVEKIPLDTEKGIKEMAELIRSCREKPQVVILDPRYGFMDGDENDTKDMTRFIDGLKRLENMLGVCFVVVAHMGKKQSLGARGNTVFEDGAETLITLTDANNKTYKKELYMIGRDIEETTLGLDLDYPILFVKSPEITDTPKVDQAKSFIRTLLETKPDGELRASIVRAGRAENWSPNVMQRALDQLQAEGLIVIEPAPGIAGNHKQVRLACLPNQVIADGE